MINSQIGLWEFIKEVFKVVDSGPPFVDITYFLYYKLFGFSTEMELIVNSLYLGAGIIGVYGIGKYFFNRNTGVLAVLIFTTLPGVLIFNNLGYREFHIMCIVALTLYFLFYSDNFANGKFSILFGASLGLLFMIKYQGLIFVAVPIFKTLADVIYKRFFLKKESKGLFFNITRSLTLFFIIGLFWYV
ncbi:MAG: glycosyltransferase family 39 protein, partial [Candidatus Omnitrophica bacterium]|nr:glycosyltransferase family 39 protein [Candidatus Omnitrophota bacterium]